MFKKIYVEVTNVCNLSCSFCPVSNRNPKFLSVEEFEYIAHMIRPYTEYLYLHVKGEPLLHPNLAEILHICENKGFKVNITTNGTLISKVKEILYNSKALRQINFSLHSFENYLEQVDQCNNYLDNIFEAALHFEKHTDTLVSFRLWNLDNLLEEKEQLNQNSFILDRLSQTFETSIVNQKSGRGIKLSNHIYLNQDFEFAWPSLDAPHISDHGYCYGLKTHIGILSDGTVIPCCLDGEGVISLGNIFNTNIDDILSCKRATLMKSGFAQRKLEEDFCKRCGYRDRFS